MDETWIHHFTPESNRLSAEWIAAGETRPKQLKMQTSAGKVLASIFWYTQGILFINYLEKGRTINSKYYIALLVHLKEEITKKQPQMKKKKCSFTKSMHCHKSIPMMAKLHELHFKLLLHPPCSPDLVPIDYCQLQTSKECSRGKRFGSNEEVILETEVFFEAKDKSFYKKHIELLEKCITVERDYVDE